MSTELAIDLYGDDAHPAAYDDNPTPLLVGDPDTDRWAAWHLRQLARLEERAARLERAFDDEMLRLRDRRDEHLTMLERRMEWHRTPLRQYHAQIIAEDPKAKTVVLPGGELRSRTPQTPSLKVNDVEAFAAWALSHHPDRDLVSITTHVAKSVEKANVKKVIEAGEWHPMAKLSFGDELPVVDTDGVVIPGISLALGERTFSVHTDGGEL